MVFDSSFLQSYYFRRWLLRQSLISGAESNKWVEVFTGVSEDKVLSLAAGFDNVLFVCSCVESGDTGLVFCTI